MRSEELLDAIGGAKDAYVHDTYESRHSRRPRRFSLFAACLALTMGLGLLTGLLGAGGGSGSDDDQSYFVYAGPVLPMTALSETREITAERNVMLDFSDYEKHSSTSHQIAVTDSYTLTNGSAEDQTITLCYPYVGSLYEVNLCPTIRVNGEWTGTTLYPGSYAGGFEGPWGAEDRTTGSYNLKLPASFEDFEALLSGTDYLCATFSEYPSLDQTVSVYRFHDYTYPQEEIKTSARLQMAFTIDPEKTWIFSDGFNGFSFDRESGACTRSISYRTKSRELDDAFLVVLGKDLADYNIRSFRITEDNGEAPCPELGCTVTRYETTLEQVLLHIMEKSLRCDLNTQAFTGDASAHIPLRDLYLGLTARLLEDWGPYGKTPVERHANGDLGMILSAVQNHVRVMYLTFDVAIPAGESVTVTAWMPKEASYDIDGSERDREGYGLATKLGTSLTFTKQTASITGFDRIVIEGQNFGFDPEHGILSVELTDEHYWIEVRRLE